MARADAAARGEGDNPNAAVFGAAALASGVNPGDSGRLLACHVCGQIGRCQQVSTSKREHTDGTIDNCARKGRQHGKNF
jgi:hypothetical protein